MYPFEWIVSQIGAREHFSVPRGFFHQGNLRALYTDLWFHRGRALLRRGPGAARALAGRFHADLPSRKVVSFPLRSLWQRWRARRAGTTDALYGEYARFGSAYARWVVQDLARQSLDASRVAFFGYNTGCLETLQMLGARGVLSIVDQIDPARTEEEMVLREVQKWPGWQETPGRIPEAYFERLAAEWKAASLVLVNSEWSKQALVAQGVPVEKLLMVPVAYEMTDAGPSKAPARETASRALTVLWIGTVNLRKGIQYLIGAARLLERAGIRFVVAGPLEISRSAVTSAPANVAFVGRITRDMADVYYRQADLFVLPTISDGFAITQVEAMARGLPVVTTPNCGEVVSHGVDGLIVPAGDEHALADAIAKLADDRGLLDEMSRQALVKARTFGLSQQAGKIQTAMQDYRQALAAGASKPTGRDRSPSGL